MDSIIEEFLGYMNLLNHMAMNENALKTQDMIRNIADFLKYKFIRKDEIVTLKEELNHIEKLIGIFKKRFGDNLEFKLNIDEKSADLYIPSFTLLAFVENALFNSLIPKEGGWRLELGVRAVENDIHISISDNGIGFDEHGAISGTILRLQSYFGVEDIVSISRNRGIGTGVYISIPGVLNQII